jgi:hypothetical protein
MIEEILEHARCNHNEGIIEGILEDMGPIPEEWYKRTKYYVNLKTRYDLLCDFNALLPD